MKKSRFATVCHWLPDLLLVAFAAFLVVFAAQFIANQNFWLDEYYSIHLVELDWAEIPDFTAGDVHPPLYYYILKVFVTLFGNAHAVYRIASFAAYLLTVGMALVLFRPAFGRLATFFFLCLMGPNAASLHYFTEVRMYGWALFFVLLCGFSGYKLVEGRAHWRRWWITLTLTGLIAGYLHYYALLAVGLIYLSLLIYSIAKRRPLLRNWGIAVGLSVVCYLPWVILTAGRLTKQVSTFWLQEMPALSETLELVVGNRLSSWLVLALFVAACLLYLFWPRGEQPARRWLVATGLLVAVGLPAAGYAASILLRPMYLPRYHEFLYRPASPLAQQGLVALHAAAFIARIGRAVKAGIIPLAASAATDGDKMKNVGAGCQRAIPQQAFIGGYRNHSSSGLSSSS